MKLVDVLGGKYDGTWEYGAQGFMRGFLYLETIPYSEVIEATIVERVGKHVFAEITLSDGIRFKVKMEDKIYSEFYERFLKIGNQAENLILPHRRVSMRGALISSVILLFVIGILNGNDGDSGYSKSNVSTDGAPFKPDSACNVLADYEGFQPTKTGYSELYDGIYTCGTYYKDLTDALIPNNIALYLRGSHDRVTRAKLMLNVNELKNAATDTEILASFCNDLVVRMADSSPQDFKSKIVQGDPFEVTHAGYYLFLDKTVWPSGKGYELNCGLKTKNHVE